MFAVSGKRTLKNEKTKDEKNEKKIIGIDGCCTYGCVYNVWLRSAGSWNRIVIFGSGFCICRRICCIRRELGLSLIHIYVPFATSRRLQGVRGERNRGLWFYKPIIPCTMRSNTPNIMITRAFTGKKLQWGKWPSCRLSPSTCKYSFQGRRKRL